MLLISLTNVDLTQWCLENQTVPSRPVGFITESLFSKLLLLLFWRGRRPHISHAAHGSNQLRSDSIMKKDQYIQIFL